MSDKIHAQYIRDVGGRLSIPRMAGDPVTDRLLAAFDAASAAGREVVVAPNNTGETFVARVVEVHEAFIVIERVR